MAIQTQTLKDLADNHQQLHVGHAAVRADEFTANLNRLSSPFRVGLRSLAENGRHVAQTQRPLALSKKSARCARDQRRNVGTDSQQATIRVAESESMMSLRASHAVLEKGIV